MDLTPTTTATLADSGNTYDCSTLSTIEDGINTPSTSHRPDNSFQGAPTSSVTSSDPTGTPLAPEPTILLNQIQQAAEDLSQLVGRFGPKMPRTFQRPSIKYALFADPKLLRLPCLRFCANPIDYKDSAPSLWWLWEGLLYHLQPTAFTKNYKLGFTPAHETDIAHP
ncbi:hypothetical protein MCOR27_003185 [Pyricularia oryzae]|uniref:Uncharacterized protein n=2 Tax=Pyricularia TaxID=48558 RepID=A0ABQ8NC49_PYRGI|nr:hypothetical protein MCOR01_006632 [Pyricularia oryzae]KAI6293825.1 hypothetical protein MCOR33_008870 [Pyricularia grisea]KAH9433040.1 hypothetical protein MCOR02_007711 [Pyricularia oryzae]KAI6253239.1 hypothetical protein MCOR19_010190 [Pyricularia oryzae]KAI6276550.1 hypothetical protein MCOR26_005550 [Pyricularia oryzae]